jgi:hypothetical protein
MPMNPIQKRAERVRRIPLESVLRSVGAKPDPHDRQKWHTSEGALSLTGPKFMNWTRGIGGGGAIDLVLHLRHCGFMEALQWLERNFPVHAGPLLLESAIPKPLNLPRPHPEKLCQVQEYLLLQRALPARLIVPLVELGRVYADAQANAVFLLLGEKNNPVGAELRGTCLRRGSGRQSTAVSWRGMAPGSRKDQGFFSAGPEHANSVVLCESAIDALSCCALHPQHRCLSTAGARPNPGWLCSLIAQGRQIFCGFDADPTGEAMAHEMIAHHPSVRRMRPSKKDWNEVLRSI